MRYVDAAKASPIPTSVPCDCQAIGSTFLEFAGVAEA